MLEGAKKWLHVHPINVGGFFLAVGGVCLNIASSGYLAALPQNRTGQTIGIVVSAIAALMQLYRNPNATTPPSNSVPKTPV